MANVTSAWRTEQLIVGSGELSADEAVRSIAADKNCLNYRVDYMDSGRSADRTDEAITVGGGCSRCGRV